jgi:enoyl-CoA hydratase/carnithine racemase
MPFVDLGLVPEAGSSLLLPQRVGLARASEMLMLCESFGAEDAQRLGLVNAVVANADLYAHAAEKARVLAAKPRAAIATTRRLLRGDRPALVARMREEAQAFSRAMQSDEARQAFTSFMSRSKPAS